MNIHSTEWVLCIQQEITTLTHVYIYSSCFWHTTPL